MIRRTPWCTSAPLSPSPLAGFDRDCRHRAMSVVGSRPSCSGRLQPDLRRRRLGRLRGRPWRRRRARRSRTRCRSRRPWTRSLFDLFSGLAGLRRPSDADALAPGAEDRERHRGERGKDQHPERSHRMPLPSTKASSAQTTQPWRPSRGRTACPSASTSEIVLPRPSSSALVPVHEPWLSPIAIVPIVTVVPSARVHRDLVAPRPARRSRPRSRPSARS